MDRQTCDSALCGRSSVHLCLRRGPRGDPPGRWTTTALEVRPGGRARAVGERERAPPESRTRRRRPTTRLHAVPTSSFWNRVRGLTLAPRSCASSETPVWPAAGEERVSPAFDHHTCFAATAVLSPHRRDTIEIVPERSTRALVSTPVCVGEGQSALLAGGSGPVERASSPLRLLAGVVASHESRRGSGADRGSSCPEGSSRVAHGSSRRRVWICRPESKRGRDLRRRGFRAQRCLGSRARMPLG